MGVGEEMRREHTFVFVFLFLLIFAMSGCRRSNPTDEIMLTVKLKMYCALTGATADYSLKIPSGMQFSVEAKQRFLTLFLNDGSEMKDSVRRFIVKCVLLLVDGANSGKGRLTAIKGSKGPYFWMPTRYFTYSPTARAYSVAGSDTPMFSLSGVSGGRITDWHRIGYEQFRKAAQKWLSETAREG